MVRRLAQERVDGVSGGPDHHGLVLVHLVLDRNAHVRQFGVADVDVPHDSERERLAAGDRRGRRHGKPGERGYDDHRGPWPAAGAVNVAFTSHRTPFGRHLLIQTPIVRHPFPVPGAGWSTFERLPCTIWYIDLAFGKR